MILLLSSSPLNPLFGSFHLLSIFMLFFQNQRFWPQLLTVKQWVVRREVLAVKCEDTEVLEVCNIQGSRAVLSVSLPILKFIYLDTGVSV